MKNLSLLILLIFSLSLSACTGNGDKNLINEKEADQNMSTYNSDEVLSRINDINNGATPKVSPKDTKGGTEIKDQDESEAKPSKQLKNLSQQFSQALIKTNLGDIKVKFYSEESPLTVNNFMNLAEEKFYDGTRFHRIIDDFMIQGGDPLSKDESMKDRWGTGGPEYRFNDEINSHKLVRGSLAMANSGPNTNGSQFFIVTKDSTPWLDGKHTNFGEVVEGMDVVEKIEAVETTGPDRPVEDIIVESVELLPGFKL